MTKIINGKKIADNIADELKKKVSKLNKKPSLAIIMYKPDERSRVYVDLKQSRAIEIGIDVQLLDWSNFSHSYCLEEMKKLSGDETIDGIIVQLPISDWKNPQELLDLIAPEKDVDGLSRNSMEDLGDKKAKLIPATVKAILTALEREKVSLNDKKVVIVGQGKLVGLPLSIILKNHGYLVKTADTNTKNLNSITVQADILVSATGVPNIIKAEMVKKEAVVIDVGIVEVNGKLAGDVNYKEVENKCSLIAKVPGGIGPITVVSLLENVIISATQKDGI